METNAELNKYMNAFQNTSRNKSLRIMIAICVDSSQSMQASVEQINKGILTFLDRLAANNTARNAAELCVVSFGNEIKDVCEFGSVTDAIQTLKRQGGIKARGSDTRMADGILHTLALIDQRTEDFTSIGVSYYKPWLLIISDGDASDPPKIQEKAEIEVRKRLRDGRIRTKCLSMGEGSSSLKNYTDDGEVSKLEDLGVVDFFEMLSRSVSEYSRSSMPPAHSELWG